MNKEKLLSLEQIGNNVNELKGKFRKDLISQVISNKSELVNQLFGNLKKKFKLTCKITSKPFTIVQEICNEFVTDFNKLEDKSIYIKLVYNEIWKESEESIANIIKEIFDVLKDIWNNSAFKKQSIASANKKGDGFIKRHSNIIFVLVQKLNKSSFITKIQSKFNLLEEKAKEATLVELKAKNTKLKTEKVKFKAKHGKYTKLKVENTKFLKQITEEYIKIRLI
ncbi:hypothetical protein Glove_707g51 [Diversispora epigaea]|uniref:Uncharacterized protein n=1 Tax=Diversispora epigaea TaxID=1348612 RepID=A0A397G1L3_9GLOM|nr:hypothetical protein Glove_707g51 [Diversispora epigaea]